MDSMRSLNTSLPGGTSPPKQQAGDPPEALLSAFRAAALSVTKLYKTASSDQARTRAEGYQDALDELLAFLDREDIGLSDGEGWRIRRWATERLDGRESAPHAESDEENSEKVDRSSSRSPVLQRSQPTTNRPHSIPRSTRTASPEQAESTVPVHNIPPPIEEEDEDEPTKESNLPQSAFTFRSQHTYPPDSDIILADLDASESNRAQNRSSSVGSHGTNSRNPSQTARTNSRRINARGGTAIGRGAGQKRKMNFADYNDFFGIDLDKDKYGGGGKRGRYA